MAHDERKPEVSTERREFLRVGAAAGAAAVAGTALGCGNGKTTTEHLPDVTLDHEVRWVRVVDLRRCIGCKACAVACKTENDVRLGVLRRSVKEYVTGSLPNTQRFFVSWQCNHCSVPACIENCPVDPVGASLTFADGEVVEYERRATYLRPDGLVLVDQDRCVGCGNCVRDCPYRARYLDPVIEAGGAEGEFAANKCTMCVHRLANGTLPACENTCQADAILVGNLNDPDSNVSQALADNEANVSVLLPDEGTEPACFYIMLEPNAYEEGTDTLENPVP